jgi:hypothetical protein
MLKKCLKYDFRSVFRLWWIMAVSMLGAAIVAGLGIRFFSQCAASPDVPEGLLVISSFTMIGSMFCIMAMVMGMTVSFILVFWRMYTHFYTDEGYLTFTLPVKRSTLYLSKVIMGTLLQFATILVLIFGVLFIALVAPPTESGEFFLSFEAFQAIGEFFANSWDACGAWVILWVPTVLAILLLLGLFQSGLIYLCITIGAVVAKKHKLIAAIGIYYGVNTVVGLIGEFILMFLMAGVIGIITAAMYAGGAVMGLTITAVLLIIALAFATLAAIVHFMALNKIEKKLNLA